MKTIFSKLYYHTLKLAGHAHATWYLAFVAFIEAIFFPVPVDVLLLPMVLSKPEKAWHYAALVTLMSVVGGIAGYLIGAFFAQWIPEWFAYVNLTSVYEKAVKGFESWGVWIIFIAGFTPIPYKVFTLTAGMFSMAFLPFMLAATVGRGARYFLVSGLAVIFGKRIEPFIVRYLDLIGWSVVLILVVVWGIMQFF